MDSTQHILITGGASGIGHSTAKLLSSSGASLVICDRQAEDGFDIPAGENTSITYVRADVRDGGAMGRCLPHIPQGLNGLVLCAAVGPPLADNPVEIVETNFKAAVENILACSPGLTEWTSIVLVSSTAAYRDRWDGSWSTLLEEPFGGARSNELWAKIEEMTGREAYALSKWGVVEATKRLARQLGPRRVRVNCVVPGPTKTAMSRPLWQGDEAAWERLENESPFRASNAPQEVAEVVAFLLSPAARMVHGSFIHIDGGWYSCHADE